MTKLITGRYDCLSLTVIHYFHSINYIMVSAVRIGISIEAFSASRRQGESAVVMPTNWALCVNLLYLYFGYGNGELNEKFKYAPDA
jgi:hypothetical protein